MDGTSAICRINLVTQNFIVYIYENFADTILIEVDVTKSDATTQTLTSAGFIVDVRETEPVPISCANDTITMSTFMPEVTES